MSRYLGYPRAKEFGSKPFLVIMVVAIATIMTDTALLKVSGFISSELTRTSSVIIFTLVSAILLVSQYLVLGHVRAKIRQIGIDEIATLRIVRLGIIVGQYSMSGVLAFLILQIFLVSYFNTVLLTLLITVSYSLSIAAISLLALRFLHWYRSNRNSLVLLYGIASLALVLNAVFSLAFAVAILNDKNPQVIPRIGIPALDPGEGSLKHFLDQAYILSSIASFIIMWISTTLILRHYSEKVGRTSYWIILSIPLVYFLTQFLVLFVDIFEPLVQADPAFVSFVLTIVFTVSKPAGGVLFGVAFWIVSRKANNPAIQNYLTIAGYGLILFFTSNQAVVLVWTTFYPPFGIGSVTYVGVSSYLILLGIYFSAISVSQDKKILSDIRKTAINELKLLESIGSAEKKEKIVSAVTKIAKENQAELVSESGVRSALDEDDMRKYLEDVINEIRSSRKEKSGEKDAEE